MDGGGSAADTERVRHNDPAGCAPRQDWQESAHAEQWQHPRRADGRCRKRARAHAGAGAPTATALDAEADDLRTPAPGSPAPTNPVAPAASASHVCDSDRSFRHISGDESVRSSQASKRHMARPATHAAVPTAAGKRAAPRPPAGADADAAARCTALAASRATPGNSACACLSCTRRAAGPQMPRPNYMRAQKWLNCPCDKRKECPRCISPTRGHARRADMVSWLFEVVQEWEWRVCGALQACSASPSSWRKTLTWHTAVSYLDRFLSVFAVRKRMLKVTARRSKPLFCACAWHAAARAPGLHRGARALSPYLAQPRPVSSPLPHVSAAAALFISLHFVSACVSLSVWISLSLSLSLSRSRSLSCLCPLAHSLPPSAAPRSLVQLVGISCLILAIKYEETESVHMESFLDIYCHGQYTKQEIIAMEQQILKVLNFDLQMVTPVAYLETAFWGCETSDGARYYAHFLTDVLLLDGEKRFDYHPAVIAGAAFKLALHVRCRTCGPCARARHATAAWCCGRTRPA